VRQHNGIHACIFRVPTKTSCEDCKPAEKKNPQFQDGCVLMRDAEIQLALERSRVEDIWSIWL
jgi:hypothetical protein